MEKKISNTEWLELIQLQIQSGLSGSQFCKKNQIRYGTFKYKKATLYTSQIEGLNSPSTSSHASFLRIAVKPDHSKTTSVNSSSEFIKVNFPNGILIECPVTHVQVLISSLRGMM